MHSVQEPFIALIGFGTIGIPIADKLYHKNRENFALIANGERRIRLSSQDLYINDQPFAPIIISGKEDAAAQVDLLIVCVKNYDLRSSLSDFKDLVTNRTIILPLQNGVFAHEFFAETFPNNVILQGYVQGPNTEKRGNRMYYQNPGAMHIGTRDKALFDRARTVFEILYSAGIDVHLEESIQKMVWKKWMLNVAGNSVTALTGADYSQFRQCENLRRICVGAMDEFVQVAKAEGIDLGLQDINDTIDYYVSYQGNKKTSTLMDVLGERKTENDFLAGKVIEIASKHSIQTPIIKSLYYLLAAKEQVYFDKKGGCFNA